MHFKPSMFRFIVFQEIYNIDLHMACIVLQTVLYTFCYSTHGYGHINLYCLFLLNIDRALCCEVQYNLYFNNVLFALACSAGIMWPVWDLDILIVIHVYIGLQLFTAQYVAWCFSTCIIMQWSATSVCMTLTVCSVIISIHVMICTLSFGSQGSENSCWLPLRKDMLESMEWRAEETGKEHTGREHMSGGALLIYDRNKSEP